MTHAEALGQLQELLAKQLMGLADGVQCAACGIRASQETHEESCPVARGLDIIETALKDTESNSPLPMPGILTIRLGVALEAAEKNWRTGEHDAVLADFHKWLDEHPTAREVHKPNCSEAK